MLENKLENDPARRDVGKETVKILQKLKRQHIQSPIRPRSWDARKAVNLL